MSSTVSPSVGASFFVPPLLFLSIFSCISFLSFHLFLDEGKEILELKPGAFGIPEPEPSAPTIRPDEEDILIVPTTAANADGYRLGKGGGFYDRLIDRDPYRRMEKWAVLPEKLLDAPFPAEPHDLRLNKIITEERIVTYP